MDSDRQLELYVEISLSLEGLSLHYQIQEAQTSWSEEIYIYIFLKQSLMSVIVRHREKVNSKADHVTIKQWRNYSGLTDSTNVLNWIIVNSL